MLRPHSTGNAKSIDSIILDVRNRFDVHSLNKATMVDIMTYFGNNYTHDAAQGDLDKWYGWARDLDERIWLRIGYYLILNHSRRKLAPYSSRQKEDFINVAVGVKPYLSKTIKHAGVPRTAEQFIANYGMDTLKAMHSAFSNIQTRLWKNACDAKLELLNVYQRGREAAYHSLFMRPLMYIRQRTEAVERFIDDRSQRSQ